MRNEAGAPLWITGMGFSARAQAVITEIENADDWGLSADAFELPPAADLPSNAEAQAGDEVKLDLAILKYARFARGGRLSPARISVLLDQKPTLRDPKTVLKEIGAAPAPDAYLRSLHPKHVQFERLRQALIKARANGKRAAASPDIQRIVINMERWRWMPAQLGAYHVQDNIPEFISRVVKNGKSVYATKVVVGLPKYATPIFSADMRSIVFNPSWTVPETIVLEDLQPALKGNGYGPDLSILNDHELTVSYQGKPVDPVDGRLGQRQDHVVHIHPAAKSRQCAGQVQVQLPQQARHLHARHHPARVLRRDGADGEPWLHPRGPARTACRSPPRRGQRLVAGPGKGRGRQDGNSVVMLSHKIPVHLTYFTATVDDKGKVQAFADVYGIDGKMAAALFGKAAKFDAVTADADAAPPGRKRAAWNNSRGGLTDAINGLFGN